MGFSGYSFGFVPSCVEPHTKLVGFSRVFSFFRLRRAQCVKAFTFGCISVMAPTPLPHPRPLLRSLPIPVTPPFPLLMFVSASEFQKRVRVSSVVVVIALYVCVWVGGTRRNVFA